MKKISIIVISLLILLLGGCFVKVNLDKNENDNISSMNKDESGDFEISGDSYNENDNAEKIENNLFENDELALEALWQGKIQVSDFFKYYTVLSGENVINDRLKFEVYDLDYKNHSEEVMYDFGYYMQNSVSIEFEGEKVIVKCFSVNPKYYTNDNILTVMYSSAWDAPVKYNIKNVDMNESKILSQEEFKTLHNIQDADDSHQYFLNEIGDVCYQDISNVDGIGAVEPDEGVRAYNVTRNEEIKVEDFLVDYWEM